VFGNLEHPLRPGHHVIFVPRQLEQVQVASCRLCDTAGEALRPHLEELLRRVEIDTRLWDDKVARQSALQTAQLVHAPAFPTLETLEFRTQLDDGDRPEPRLV